MEVFNKNAKVSIIEVTLFPVDTIAEYLYFLDKRHWDSVYYDPEVEAYFSDGDAILTLEKIENIDKYILKQEYPIPEQNTFKELLDDVIDSTFEFKKEYLTVYDIVNICLTKHTRRIVCQDDLARLLISILIEVYLPLAPVEQQKGIYNLAECLFDLWGASLERYASAV
jgi:hypothetical protein